MASTGIGASAIAFRMEAGDTGRLSNCCQCPPMMSLPFFGVFFSVLSAWMGFRRIALGLALVSIVGTLALFRMHATDALQIAL